MKAAKTVFVVALASSLAACVPYSSWWKHPQTGEVVQCGTHSVLARERALELSECENTMRAQGFRETSEPD
jgi:hypothetical protein